MCVCVRERENERMRERSKERGTTKAKGTETKKEERAPEDGNTQKSQHGQKQSKNSHTGEREEAERSLRIEIMGTGTQELEKERVGEYMQDRSMLAQPKVPPPSVLGLLGHTPTPPPTYHGVLHLRSPDSKGEKGEKRSEVAPTGPDGTGRGKLKQTPWGREGRGGYGSSNKRAQSRLQQWQVQPRETGQSLAGAMPRERGSIRVMECVDPGREILAFSKEWTCSPLARPGMACRTDLHPSRMLWKVESRQPAIRAPSPAPAHFPPNPISTAQCFQLPRPSLQSSMAPPPQNPPKGPAASESP
jgi:hypothetical protein